MQQMSKIEKLNVHKPVILVLSNAAATLYRRPNPLDSPIVFGLRICQRWRRFWDYVLVSPVKYTILHQYSTVLVFRAVLVLIMGLMFTSHNRLFAEI